MSRRPCIRGWWPWTPGARVDWTRTTEHDVLKALYTSIISPRVREALGEYYTPDWLANRMIEAVYTDPSGRQRSIDLLPGGLPTRSWSPSLPALQLMGALNVLTLDGLTSDIALRFTPKGTLFGSGTWRLDDVYVDPWKVI